VNREGLEWDCMDSAGLSLAILNLVARIGVFATVRGNATRLDGVNLLLKGGLLCVLCGQRLVDDFRRKNGCDPLALPELLLAGSSATRAG
jgi:hypothetical protein